MTIQFQSWFISHIKNDRTHSDMKCQFLTSSSRTEEFYALKCCTLHKHAILTNHLQETVNGFVPLIAYYSLIGATCKKFAKYHVSIWVWQKNNKKLACNLGLNCQRVTYCLIAVLEYHLNMCVFSQEKHLFWHNLVVPASARWVTAKKPRM